MLSTYKLAIAFKWWQWQAIVLQKIKLIITTTTKMPSETLGLCEEQIRMYIIIWLIWWNITQVGSFVIQNNIYISFSAYYEPGSVLNALM